MVSVRAAESNRVSRTYHGELTPNAASNSCSVCIAIAPFLMATVRDETIIYPLGFRKRLLERALEPMLHHEVEKMKALVPLFLGALFGVSAVLVYERVVPATYPLVDASPVPSSQPSAPDHLNSSKMPPNTPVPDADLLIAQAVDDPEGVLHLLP